MKAGKHVLTEKLMGHSVHECKEMARVAKQIEQASGHRPSAALQHSVRQRGRHDPPRPDRRDPQHPRPVAPRQPARQRQLVAAAARRQDGPAAGQARQRIWKSPRAWRSTSLNKEIAKLAVAQARDRSGPQQRDRHASSHEIDQLTLQYLDHAVNAENYGYQEHHAGRRHASARPSRS